MNGFFFRLMLFEGFSYERYDAFLMCWIQFCLFCTKLGISYFCVSAFSGVVMEFSTQSDFQFR